MRQLPTRLLRTYAGPYAPGRERLQLHTIGKKDREEPAFKYAILSHCWGEDEVVFENVQNGTARDHPDSHRKIANATQQAASDGYQYLWIDSCCIDKSSSAELQEAINSMYAWYQEAEVCYAILDDVPGMSDTGFDTKFAKSKWFTRGWTLQELLAPKQVYFFGAVPTGAWTLLGSRDELSSLTSKATPIDARYLKGKRKVHDASIAERMSWAAKRETTRIEDLSYSLLGIFSVNMPMLYGEGPKAFMRLQEEIMKVSDDQSIFAWMHSRPGDDSGCEFEAPNYELQTGELFRYDSNTTALLFKSYTKHGLLADSPAAFLHSGEVVPVNEGTNKQPPYRMTNRGLKIRLNLIPLSENPRENKFIADINCRVGQPWDEHCYDFDQIAVGVYLLKLYPQQDLYARLRCDRIATFDAMETNIPLDAELTKVYVRQTVTKPSDHFCGAPSARLITFDPEPCNTDGAPEPDTWLANL